MEQFSKFKCLYSASQVVNNLLQFNKYSTADKLKIERMVNSLKSMAFKVEKKGE